MSFSANKPNKLLVRALD